MKKYFNKCNEWYGSWFIVIMSTKYCQEYLNEYICQSDRATYLFPNSNFVFNKFWHEKMENKYRTLQSKFYFRFQN